jgi:pimeloyl-ACP methyl ester carboxylesterase
MKVTQKLAITYIRIQFKVIAAISSVIAAERAFTLFCTPFPKRKRQAPALFATAETLQLQLDDNTLTGWRWNKGGTKKVLILHGFASCAYNFHTYIKDFVQKGYEVLAFDAPAHGRSSGKTVNVVQYSNMILAINQYYGPVDSYLAHSFGGIAIGLALEQLVHGPNVSVALVAPATETTTAIDHAFALLGLRSKNVRTHFNNIIERLSGKPATWFSLRRAVHNIQASILWLHDEDDTVTPLADALQVQADNHTHIRFVITKGLGHQQIYRDASVRSHIVNFL